MTWCIVRSLFLCLCGFCGSSDTDICSLQHCILSREGKSGASSFRLNGCFSVGCGVCASLLLPLPAGAHMQAAERREDYVMSTRDAGR